MDNFQKSSHYIHDIKEREDDISSKASTLSLTIPNDEATSTNTTVATTIKSVKRTPSFRQRQRKMKPKKDIDDTVTKESNKQLTDKAWNRLIQSLNVSGNIALASSVELFKLTVLPSVNLTKTYIVPEIASKLLNSMDENVSQRILDWSTIGLECCNKAVELLTSKNSESVDGEGFKDKIGNVGDSFVEFVSSDQGRQCLIDFVGLYVKCMDALR